VDSAVSDGGPSEKKGERPYATTFVYDEMVLEPGKGKKGGKTTPEAGSSRHRRAEEKKKGPSERKIMRTGPVKREEFAIAGKGGGDKDFFQFNLDPVYGFHRKGKRRFAAGATLRMCPQEKGDPGAAMCRQTDQAEGGKGKKTGAVLSHCCEERPEAEKKKGTVSAAPESKKARRRHALTLLPASSKGKPVACRSQNSRRRGTRKAAKIARISSLQGRNP